MIAQPVRGNIDKLKELLDRLDPNIKEREEILMRFRLLVDDIESIYTLGYQKGKNDNFLQINFNR